MKDSLIDKALEMAAQEKGRVSENKLSSHNSHVQMVYPEKIDESAYYGVVGEIVKEIEPYTEADPVAILLQLLVALGALIGKTARFIVEADIHYFNLFLAVIGETAKGRKGTSLGYAKRIVNSIEVDFNKCIKSGLSSGEGVIWQVRDPITKIEAIREKKEIIGYRDVISDPGIEDKRLLVVETEFASPLKVMRREGNTLSPVLRNAWDHGDLQTLTKNSPAVATNAHVSIIAHITKEELLKQLSDTDIANGFANRFIFVSSKRSRYLPFGGSERINYALFNKKLREAVKFAKSIKDVTWSDKAKPLWEAVYPSLSDVKPGLSGLLLSRSEAQVMRISGLYAILDKSSHIKPEHLKAALAVWEYSEKSVEYIFQGTQEDVNSNKTLSLINKHIEGISKTGIFSAFNNHLEANELDRTLGKLSSLGLIYSKTERTSGKSKEVWFPTSEKLRKKRIKRRDPYLDIVNPLISQNSQLELLKKQTEEVESNRKAQSLPDFPSDLHKLNHRKLKRLSIKLSAWLNDCPP